MTASYIDDIMRKLNYNQKYELTMLVINVARVRRVSAVKALHLIESGEIDLKDVKESFIKSLQKIQPKEEENTNE